jgi:hypothetical protein
MKDQINKLTEAQAKELLGLAMEEFRFSVYEHSKEESAQVLGWLTRKIETLAKSNEEQ